MAKVDVIIPAYNAAAFLPDAIESVKAQTETDWRILLVDDGSTDATATVAAQYEAELGPQFRFFQQPNRGVSAARNLALRHADAPVLALLDADDLWMPRRLEASLDRLQARPRAGLCYGLLRFMSATGQPEETWAGNERENLGRAEGSVASLLYQRRFEMPAPTVSFLRSAIDAVGGFDETMRATEDRDLWLRIAQRAEVAFVPEVLALYRRSPASASGNPEFMLQGQLLFLQKHYGEPGCGWAARQNARSLVYGQYAAALRKRGRTAAALTASARSVMITPWSPRTMRATIRLWAARLGSS